MQQSRKVYFLFTSIFLQTILFSQVIHNSVAPTLLNRGGVLFKKNFPVQEKIFYLVSLYSKKFNVNSNLILSIIHAESNFNHLAVSSKGAQGLMQIMPGTFRELNGKNSFDMSDNIRCGTEYFYRLLSSYKNIRLALAAYNAGPGNVKSTVPNFQETKTYIKKVLSYHQNFSYIQKKSEGGKNDAT